MSKRYVISITAANRVGLLAAIGTALHELGGNIDELCQTVMQDFFSVLFAADFPDNRPPQVIHDHLHDACRAYGASVTVRDPEAEPFERPQATDTRTWYLSIEGQDRPGLMGRISSKLAGRRIDVRESYGKRDDQSQSFFMAVKLAAPAKVDRQAFEAELAELANELGLSVRLYDEQDSARLDDPRLLRLQSTTTLQRLGSQRAADC